MGDYEEKAQEYEKKAEKKLKGWNLLGGKYDDAAEYLEKAANNYKLAKSWDRGAECYLRLAEVSMKMESKPEAAQAYVEAAKCYMKKRPKEAVKMLNMATKLFMELGRLSVAAKHFKDIAEIYEKQDDLEFAVQFYERAADLYQGEEVNTTSNQCKLKIAELSAQLEQYPRAIEIFEAIAKSSMDNNLTKYSVKGYLLNAGLCQMCGADPIAVSNALERYQDLDPTFQDTRECKFLKELAETIEQEDATKFTDAVKEYDSISRLDPWKTTMLLRAKKALKAKEEEEEELT
ncbi:hypothetical protein SELMODRAFT_109073 [Selaginella moellendorffii]|uniref:Alpha-soluble NSF attachment protein n=1 Tax=Selaginella moellendorffii TaxID=88036 RepID=D8S5G1_SELML|nr:alpha-soluble NSF attachment protein 2 [Selaginella moellendorffii]EFJ20447.1 hypothetical protein SELMODRAFT_109073 [Selaginella moellendorffii]|eukprot:XP_002978461.1 alpha-soluble NSF attachment protein 2 [Selaginella moellendorffii]